MEISPGSSPSGSSPNSSTSRISTPGSAAPTEPFCSFSLTSVLVTTGEASVRP